MVKKQPKRHDRPGVDQMGRTLLHYAASEGNEPEVLRLLNEGANPNARDDNGCSPLHFAAQSSRRLVAMQLIAAGAEVDALDSNGNSPLSNAVFNSRGDGELVAALRAAGANPNLENSHGISPVGLARSIGNFDVAQFFKDLP